MLSHAIVPEIKVVALKVMEHLGRIVVVVHVTQRYGPLGWLVLHEISRACRQISLVLPPAKVLPSQQARSGETSLFGPLALQRIVCVSRAHRLRGTHCTGIDKFLGSLKHIFRNWNARQLRTPNRQKDPACHRHVPRLVRAIPPTTANVLRIEQVTHG